MTNKTETLKARHYYVNKNPKGNLFINEIIPMEDRVVPQTMFDQYEDLTKGPKE